MHVWKFGYLSIFSFLLSDLFFLFFTDLFIFISVTVTTIVFSVSVSPYHCHFRWGLCFQVRFHFSIVTFAGAFVFQVVIFRFTIVTFTGDSAVKSVLRFQIWFRFTIVIFTGSLVFRTVSLFYFALLQYCHFRWCLRFSGQCFALPLLHWHFRFQVRFHFTIAVPSFSGRVSLYHCGFAYFACIISLTI